MTNNTQLADLILNQISGAHVIDNDHEKFVQLLQDALQSGQSRLELRDLLVAGARDSNKITLTDIIEVMTQSLSDEIRDLSESIDEIENDRTPSRLALGSMVGLVLGTGGSLVYGSTDPLTSAALIALFSLSALGVSKIRKRSFRKISALRIKKTNYDNFRSLLHDSK